ncbi:DUF3772 domain-containing protein [Tanticharoenia sakaeratensis]|uniref:Uncharacterized protein n=1 Tax=Tanticharoenia sakaeratensis NBRC 103193 TaxID=1231623 RepID=A0A0D6MM28_9PROT|nr:DUF3772 domain-containing protein [Tanticharoenia sakaeratensis]GAN54501.1 hypothetical protein Tasa_021_082 [Tanticharoenia sakaeratensis NBRC 103193]GBQ24295.1 mechanosensitive ion channel protein MscS [Tanticharoenia sakaeratensis NBRC 103193]
MRAIEMMHLRTRFTQFAIGLMAAGALLSSSPGAHAQQVAPNSHEALEAKAAAGAGGNGAALPFGWHASAPMVSSQLDALRHELSTLYGTLSQPDTILSADAAARLSRRAATDETTAQNLVAQLQSYQNVYEGFASVLGKTATPGEDASITKQRATITQGLNDINSDLTQAKLAQLQAHQLGLGISRQTATQHQALISQRAPSPLSPLFWRQLEGELPQDRAVLATFPALTRNADVAAARWITPTLIAVLLAALLVGTQATVVPIERVLTRFARSPKVGATPTNAIRLPLALLNGVAGCVMGWLMALAATGIFGIDQDSPFWPAVQALTPLIPTCGLAAGIGAALSRRIRGHDAPGPWPRGLAIWFCLAVLSQGVLRFLDQQSPVGLLTLELLEGVFSLVVVWTGQQAAMRLRVQAPPREEEAGTHPTPDADVPGGAAESHAVTEARFLPPLRAVCSLWAIVVTGSVILGYFSFAYVLATWVLSVSTGLAIALLLATCLRMACDVILAPQGGIASHMRRLGIQPRHLQQASVLISGAGNVFLLALLVSIGLTQGELDPSLVMNNLHGLFIGRMVGGVPVSLDTVIKCALVLIFGRTAIGLLANWFKERLFPTTRLDMGAQTSALSIFTYAAWIMLLLTVLSLAGLTVQNLAWIMSALSVGIGFGLQSIVQNFVSGIILLAERPVRIGDQVSIAGSTGDIKRISVRSTELRLSDGSILIVPNSQFITSAVRNATLGNAQAQITILFSVPPDADIERVRGLLMQVLSKRSDVLQTAAPSITVTALSASTLTLSLSVQIASSRLAGGARSGIVLDAHNAFAAAGIALSTADG